MIQKEISAKVPAKDGNPEMAATVFVDYPETLKEAKEWTTEEAMLSNGFANWRVTIQSGIRTGLKGGMTPEALQEKYAQAKMGVAATGGKVDAQAAFIAKFKSATPEKQAEMLAALKAAAAK